VGSSGTSVLYTGCMVPKGYCRMFLSDCVIACAVVGIFDQILMSVFEGVALVPLGAIIFKTVT
jgi:hypothetical protein